MVKLSYGVLLVSAIGCASLAAAQGAFNIIGGSFGVTSSMPPMLAMPTMPPMFGGVIGIDHRYDQAPPQQMNWQMNIPPMPYPMGGFPMGGCCCCGGSGSGATKTKTKIKYRTVTETVQGNSQIVTATVPVTVTESATPLPTVTVSATSTSVSTAAQFESVVPRESPLKPKRPNSDGIEDQLRPYNVDHRPSSQLHGYWEPLIPFFRKIPTE
ncbi:hypothetical protein H4R19_000234 [Coemansia spiralis]|nr:hypothetical protein H4R19_000234 [Coemansia spiralis]